MHTKKKKENKKYQQDTVRLILGLMCQMKAWVLAIYVVFIFI